MMKRIFAFVSACLLMVSLAACGSNSKSEEPFSASQVNEASCEITQETQELTETSDSPELEEMSQVTENEVKELVVYFSWSGNTEGVANEIAAQTGADVFKIVPQTAYSNDYDTVVDLARQEQRDNVRPEIAEAIENLDDYEVIYVGFPNWWGDMPMILYTFFDNYDFSGKTIAPFCTSGGSGLSDTVSEIQSLEPEATVTDGLHIRDNNVEDASESVTDWLKSIG